MRITMAELAAHVAAAKAKWNISDDEAWNERLRNPGTNRTPEKRAMLAQLDENARAAGIEPLPHRY